METNNIQRRILRILYAWGLEHFDKFMNKKEFLSRIGVDEVNKEIMDLKSKELIEIIPEDENWKAIRITPKGVQTLRLMDII